MKKVFWITFLFASSILRGQITIGSGGSTKIPLKNEFAKLHYDSTSMVLSGFRGDVGWRKIAGPIQRSYVYQVTGQNVVFPISVIPFLDAEITVNGVELKKDTHYIVINDNTIQIIDPIIRSSLIGAKF